MDVTVTISEAEAGVTFYYIAATNGVTRVFPDISGTPTFATFSVVYTPSQTSNFDISIQRGTQVLDFSRVNFTLTVIGIYIYILIILYMYVHVC